MAAAIVGTYFVAWKWWDYRDLSENLFAEAMGAAFTVLIIDGLFSADRRRREKPARVAALRRIRAIHRDISLF